MTSFSHSKYPSRRLSRVKSELMFGIAVPRCRQQLPRHFHTLVSNKLFTMAPTKKAAPVASKKAPGSHPTFLAMIQVSGTVNASRGLVLFTLLFGAILFLCLLAVSSCLTHSGEMRGIREAGLGLWSQGVCTMMRGWGNQHEMIASRHHTSMLLPYVCHARPSMHPRRWHIPASPPLEP
jgi:hypothetical protein